MTSADPSERPHDGQPLRGDGLFRVMFERSADAILLLDTSSNRFVEYNQAALDMLQCSREELSALHPSALSPELQPDGRSSFEKANEMIATAVRVGSHRFEWVHRSPHREDFPVEVLLTPLESRSQPLVLVVWRDVTERRRAEAAMQQAQRLESLGVLAGGIAHDFNNLLSAILGHLHVARLVSERLPTADEHLGHAEQAVLRAAELTRQLLAYGGKATFVVQSLSLGRAVREMAELLSVSVPRRVRVEFELPDELPVIEADRAQLQQVIMNLVTNAAEAIGDADGRIALRGAEVVLDQERIDRDFPGQALAPGRYACLEVADTGHGMSPETQARIFDPFFSTKQKGRGLGLSALRGILRGHRGGIRITSSVGEGTTFAVCFPVTEKRISDQPAKPVELPARAVAGSTVLLVDDEAMVRRSLRAQLETFGFTVLEAPDGEAAVRLFAEHRQRVQLVLMDLTMPGMDGHQAFLAMRQLEPSVQVILSSGWAESELVTRFHEAPPTAFLSKPFTRRDLASVLRIAGLLVA